MKTTKLRYWIHGPKNCGKSVLAKLLTGEASPCHSMRHPVPRPTNHGAVTLDEFAETIQNVAFLQQLNTNTVVVISKLPPKNKWCRENFYTIKITPPTP